MTPEYSTIILVVAAFTILTRIAGFQVGGRTLPPAVVRALDVVPIAAFAALIVPGIDLGGDEMLPRLIALGVAGVLFFVTGRFLAGLLAGMGVYAGLVIFL